MLRKILTMLLCLVLVLGLMTPAVCAAEEEIPLEVTLEAFGDRIGYFDLEGLYMDNVLYIHPHTVCELTGALIRENAGDSITFSLHGGMRVITVTPENGGRITETITMGRSHSASDSIPAVYYDGWIYISATHLLRYMGAEVGFSNDETGQTHMTVHMPYTVMDLIYEFDEARGYRFSWSEAEGKYLQPEDVLGLAALDTVLFCYDSNILAYASGTHAQKVGVDIYTDVLKEILRTEGAELTETGYTEVDVFGDASNVTSFSANWIKEVLGWVEDPKLLSNVNSTLSGAMDSVGLLLNVGGDYLKTLDTAMQFANMSTNQQQLLDMTLNMLPAENEFCQQLPELFIAAEEVSTMISGEYDANKAAAWNSIYSLMVNASTSAMNSVNPFALAWDSFAAIAKMDPLMSELLNDEKSIVFAGESQNVQVIAWDLLDQDYSMLYSNAFFLNGNQTFNEEYQQYLKMDVILALKSALTARCLLMQTGWLTEASQNGMEMTAVRAAKLLQKAQNARPVLFEGIDDREEDLTWIANLVANGEMGHVVSIAGNTYYWQYGAESFYEYGVVGFSHAGATNKFMRMDRDGKTEVLLELDSYGQFAIVNCNTLFYKTHDNQICSITLDGKTSKNWGEGYLKGVSDDGAYVYYENYDGALWAICPREEKQINIGSDLNFVTLHDGRLYASSTTEDERAQSGIMTLYSMEPDGTDWITICTTESLYEYSSGFSYADVAQMRFTEDYLYFSYGSIAGTGLFFQGGKIVRAKYDGSESVVLAGQDELVGAQFSVNADGSVNANAEEYAEVYFEYMRTCGASGGTIYCYDDQGHEVSLAGSGDYDLLGSGLAGVYDEATGSIIQLDFAEVVNGKGYYLLHLAVPNTDDWMSWREEYKRSISVMYMRDLETGQVTVLFQC